MSSRRHARALVLAAPFILVATYHYVRFATLESSTAIRASRRDAHVLKTAARFGRGLAAAGTQPGTQPAGAAGAAGAVDALAAVLGTNGDAAQPAPAAQPALAAQEAAKPAAKPAAAGGRIVGAHSSEAATAAVLASGGLSSSATAGGMPGLRGVVTAEQVDAVLPKGDIVWITFSNAAYMHFAQNWYMSTVALKREKQVVIAALDPQSLQIWSELGAATLDFSHFGDASDFRGIGSDQARFRRMGAMKVAAFLSLLRLGRSVLVSDVDSYWRGDPEPFLRSRPELDVAVTSDCLSREADGNKRGDSKRFHPAGVWFCGHNPGNTYGATFNTGVLFLRPTARALAFTDAWRLRLLAPTEDWHMEDQRAFNMMATENYYPVQAAPTVSDGSVVLAANRSLWLMPLPSGLFCSGHTFFVQMSGEGDCLHVHVTFTEGGVHGKLWRLKEAGLWNLEPPGYFEEGRYLTFRPPAVPVGVLPAERVEPFEACQARVRRREAPSAAHVGWWSPPGADTRCVKEVAQYKDKNGDMGVTIDEGIAMSPRLQAHLVMADRYMVALRDGMTIAWLLNRTFVFPHFSCLCDRSEWPEILPTCRLETSDLAFPFKCPLNFLINVHFMQGIEQGNGVFPGLPYREYSFLANQRLGRRLTEERASVSFRGGAPGAAPGGGQSQGEAAPAAEAAGATPTRAVLPRGATDEEVLAALGGGSAYEQVAVLELEDAEDVLGGFEDAERGTHIRNLLDSKVLYGSWCCSRTNFHNPGATAFFNRPPKQPMGEAARRLRALRSD